MAKVEEVDGVLGGNIGALVLHTDFDIYDVRYCGLSIVFLLSSKQSIGLAELIYQTSVPPPLERNLGS